MIIEEIKYKDVKSKLKSLSTKGKGIVILGVDGLLRGEYSPASVDGDVAKLSEMIIRSLTTAEIIPRFSSAEQIFKELYTFVLPNGRTDLIILFEENAQINFQYLDAWRKALTGISTLEDWSPTYR